MTPAAFIEKKSRYETTWRWWVLGTLFLATFLNYFDRQTLGTAIEPISKEFGLNNIQRGNLLAAFIFAYAFTHLLVGFVVDRIRNIRVFFPWMVLGWSASTILVGFARTYNALLWLRYLLGVWEAVNFPICLMVISRIFPAKERSLASGIFASGAFLATLAAPPVVIFLSNRFNWRYSFVVAGCLGLFWVVPWLCIFRRPEDRSENWGKYSLVRVAATESGKRNPSGIIGSLASIVKIPSFWGVALIGLGIIPSLYFATQWFPSFFTQSLGHPYNQALARKLSVIYLMQDVGLWVGGMVVLWLSQKGFSILRARKTVITVAYTVMVVSILAVTRIHSIHACVILLSLYVFGIGAFLGNQHAFKQDVDKKQVATVAALVGFIETGFTAFVIKGIGIITNQTADFTPVFFLLAGLATFAIFIVYFFMKPKWLDIQ